MTTAAVGLGGCISPTTEAPAGPTETAPPSTRSPTKETSDYWTPVRRTAEGVTATFEVLDTHRPTEETARAEFADERVVVTGSVDPVGCGRPVLTSVEYDPEDGHVRLVIGSHNKYGPTATVECGNASFDYEVIVTVERNHLVAATVVHDHPDEDQTFELGRH